MGKRKLSIIGFVSSESGEKLKIFRSPSFSENKLKNGVTTDLLKEESHRLVSEKKTISAQGNTKTSVQKERIARCVKKETPTGRCWRSQGTFQAKHFLNTCGVTILLTLGLDGVNKWNIIVAFMTKMT